jgi:hypothetical protein
MTTLAVLTIGLRTTPWRRATLGKSIAKPAAQIGSLVAIGATSAARPTRSAK